ncbi:MAG: phosphoribosylglycinamide formyltransferase [Saprospiraceae bacterium]|nr:phosphoribosylglycinamide formyltransferase [Saprospiraceae bacterium]
MRLKLAIFASGGGSNALQLMRKFKDHPTIEVSWLVCNVPGAGALSHAAEFQIPTYVLAQGEAKQEDFIKQLKDRGIDALILAGYLWKIPSALVAAYPNKIINIHPALLPAYGGKGMFGMEVHKAVVKNKEKQTGLTIHLVNEKYDEGRPLFQAICPVYPEDTAEAVASRVLALEHQYFGQIIEEYLLSVYQQS